MDKIKILVVDDEARMRKLVKDFLSIKGYQVLEAGDGEEAVDLFFQQKDIALILLDVEDGRLGGCEDDPQVFAGADHHADGERRGERRAAGL